MAYPLALVLKYAWRGAFSFGKLIVSGFNEFTGKNGLFMAAAISFSTLLSLVPLGVAIIALFSNTLGREETLNTISIGLSTIIPVFEEETGRAFLQNLINSLASNRALTSVLAIIVSFFAATNVFSFIRRGVNSIAGISRPRNFFVERIMDFTLLFGAIIMLVGSVFSTLLASFLSGIVNFFSPEANFETSFVFAWVPYLLSFGVFFILYWWLPNARIPLRAAVPNAFLAMIAFEIAKLAFVSWVRQVGGWFGEVYGGFAAVLLFLIFVYVSAIIMLVGAMLTSRLAFQLEIWDRRNLNRMLSSNLTRIRSTNRLYGIGAARVTGGASKVGRFLKDLH